MLTPPPKPSGRIRWLPLTCGLGGILYFIAFSTWGPETVWRGSLAVIPLQLLALVYVSWYWRRRSR